MSSEENSMSINDEIRGIAAREMKRRSNFTDHHIYYDSDIQPHLERYFFGLSRARKELASQFDERELTLIIDALNSTRFNKAETVMHLPSSIGDAIKFEGLASKWEVDAENLLKKLEHLDYFQRVAIIDAAEVWWNRQVIGEEPEFGQLLDWE